MNRAETKRQLPRELLSSGDLHLLPGVFFVEGEKNGALCDANTGMVYSVNEVGCQVLRNERRSYDFWLALAAIGLVRNEPMDQANKESLRSPTNLEFVWFEIATASCNERCIHCYADCAPVSYQEKPFDTSAGFSSGRKLRHSEWRDVISRARQLEAKSCQFIGGEPFMYRGEMGENVLDLAEYSKEVGYEFIEIFTNATMISQKKVERMKGSGLNVAVSLYSIKETIHDSITRTPGSFRKTMRALELLRNSEVPTRVEVVVMKDNQETIAETVRWIEENGFNHKQPDVLRPKGRGDNPLLQPDKEVLIRNSLMIRPNFFAQRETLLRNMSRNSCLAGKITITESGDVLPCIFSREEVVGNVLKQPFQQIVESERLQEIWRSTKDGVLVCQDCEYRYVCSDCRPISEAVNEGRGSFLNAPYPRCTYNPYTGEWAKGVWRLDEAGTPFYDTALEQLIQEVAIASQDDDMVLRKGR